MPRPRASKEARAEGYKRLNTVRERVQDHGPKEVLISGRFVSSSTQAGREQELTGQGLNGLEAGR
jgi:hypothetical protein